MHNLFLKFLRILNGICNFLVLRHFKVQIGKNVKFYGRIRIKNSVNKIKIGDNCVFNSDSISVPIGYPTPISFWCIGEGSIEIGNSCGISNTTFCSASNIKIGNHVMLGGGVKIYDTDFHSLEYKYRVDIENDPDRKTVPIEIKEGAFIGAGVIILKGVKIGGRSIVAAGSVVAKNIPADEVWGGNPAKFIRKVNE